MAFVKKMMNDTAASLAQQITTQELKREVVGTL